MDPVLVNLGWTLFEEEEARSLIAKHNSNKIMYGNNDDMNRKHNNIVDDLHVLFPSKIRQQVTNLYINFIIEMYMT